jgi:hypothetical protein
MRCTVFQIYFDPTQQSALDSAFVPYDNSARTTEALEFDVFRRLAASASVKSHSHWGAVSWRFFEKTGLTGRELLALVRESPEVDLWYCNPSPYLEGLFHSNWHHGHTTHPGLLGLARAFFTAAALPVQDLARLDSSNDFSTANYFVGSPRFWTAYLPFVSAAIERAEAGMPPEWLTKLHSSDADPRDLHHGSTYLPFIVERLLPTFLRGPGAHLLARRYICHREESKLDGELRALRQLKDRAIAEQSVPLAREWMQRRNVCIKPRAPADWWQQFAELLNPTEIVF